jgi:HD-like signal output (HDOD) protein
MSQIRNSNKVAGLEHHLQDLWQRSTRVAALAYVLARTCTRVNPDEALLTGMMHGIGKLYVLTRATDHPELFADTDTLDAIIREWHPSIGKAILETWEFPEDMARAVGEQEDHTRTEPEAPDLADVVSIALLMAAHPADPAALEAALQSLPAGGRLGLNETRAASVMSESAAEVAALTEALGS